MFPSITYFRVGIEQEGETLSIVIIYFLAVRVEDDFFVKGVLCFFVQFAIHETAGFSHNGRVFQGGVKHIITVIVIVPLRPNRCKFLSLYLRDRAAIQENKEEQNFAALSG
jgi:hypothetical protein